MQGKKLILYKYQVLKQFDNLYKILDQLVNNIYFNKRNLVVFQDGENIFSEREIEEEILGDEVSKDKKIIKKDLKKSTIKIFIDKALKNEEFKHLILRYIGELIALTIKNRDEKILVFREFGTINMFQATIQEDIKTFNKISIYKGFKYKPIILKEKFAVILDSKSKYFTELTLRDLLSEIKESYDYDRYLEKVCPIRDCEYNLKSFSKCNHGYPRSFGWYSDIKLEEKLSPVESNPNLIEYFKDEENCPTQLLSERISEDPPVLLKSFHSNVNKTYNYPLELIRIVPNNEDAGNKARALIDEVRPEPRERFLRIESFKKYLICLKSVKFPIIPTKILNLDKTYFKSVEFPYPKYILGDKKPLTNPANNYDDHGLYKKSLKINFQVIHSNKKDFCHQYLKPLFGEEDYPDYLEFSKLDSIDFNFTYYNNRKKIETLINSKEKPLNFFLLIYGKKGNKELSSWKKILIEKDIPNQSIKLKTLQGRGFNHFTNSLFYQIYHKSGGLTWVLDNEEMNDYYIIGISTRFSEKRQIISILWFEYNGIFKKGYFINEKEENSKEKLQEFLKEVSNSDKKYLILVNGLLTSEQNETIKNIFREKQYSLYGVYRSSIVRLFNSDSNDIISNKFVKPGNGIFIEDELHLVTSEPYRGTQVCIKINKIDSNISNDEKLYEKIFHFTRFNPSHFLNLTKLPFPVHFSSNTLKKGLKYNLKTIKFKLPFYL